MSPSSSDNEEEERGCEEEVCHREEEEEDVGVNGDADEEGGRLRRRRRSSSGDFRKLWMEGPATDDALLSKRPCVTCRKSKVGKALPFGMAHSSHNLPPVFSLSDRANLISFHFPRCVIIS